METCPLKCGELQCDHRRCSTASTFAGNELVALCVYCDLHRLSLDISASMPGKLAEWNLQQATTDPDVHCVLQRWLLDNLLHDRSSVRSAGNVRRRPIRMLLVDRPDHPSSDSRISTDR